MSLSLRQVLFLLSAIGLLPLALAGVWVARAASEQQQRTQATYMLDVARALASAVDAELDGTVGTLATMARSPALMSGDLKAFHVEARQQARTQADWIGMLLADANGQALLRTTAEYGAPAAPIADPASLQSMLARQVPVVGRAVAGPGGALAFPVRVPAADANGARYALTAIVKPDRMAKVIARQEVPASLVISVLDAAGTVVARSRDHATFVGQAATPALQRLIARGGSEGVGPSISLDGARMTAAFSRAPGYGWIVAVGVPEHHLVALVQRSWTVYVLAVVLSLLACVGLASVLAQRIASLFDRLQAGTIALGQGRPVAVPPAWIKEIQQMADALAVASTHRSQREQERAGLQDSLEQALEKQRGALAEADRASRAKDQFLAMLGHELRNPLSPIVTALDLMDAQGQPAYQRERAIMRRQVDHLKRLVDDLLDISRIISGKLSLSMRRMDLAATVRHALEAVGSDRISATLPGHAWIDGDEARVVQVVNNLLSNALRFSADQVEVALTLDGNEALLTVRDHGLGMSADLRERIFEPFFQAPQQLARAHGGLGLGLAIVRRIVELHGGQLSADSDGPGAGSVFRVRFPLAGEGAPGIATPALPDSRGHRILLVDDNQDAAAMHAALLEYLGHTVFVAHTAKEGLTEYERHAPSVAILDIGLPDMDGYALALALRRSPGGGKLRLVALTGYGQQHDIERALNAGFDAHLAKPATVQDLRAALDETAAGRLAAKVS